MTHLDSNRPARLGIVGCGAITREARLPVIVGDRRVDLAVLCDRGNAVYWKSMQPNAHDSVKAAIRLAASPAFHARLGTIPSLGQLIRSAKEMVAPPDQAGAETEDQVAATGTRRIRTCRRNALRAHAQRTAEWMRFARLI